MEVLPNLYNLLENLYAQAEVLNDDIEPQFLQVALNFEKCRGQWLRVEEELSSCREMLAEMETEKAALEVKLKHARNQVDVEIRRRQRAEADCEKLDRQIQLIRDLLISEASTSLHLNEEQRSALAFLNARSQMTLCPNTSRRLSAIDESASILSDISYDKTDTSVDWDSSGVRAVRLKRRQKRRSSGKMVDGPLDNGKKPRSLGRISERVNQSIVATTTVTLPARGGAIEAVASIQTVPHWNRVKRSNDPQVCCSGPDTQSDAVSDASGVFKEPHTPRARADSREPCTPKSTRAHIFSSKTVIRPETCTPCGKRIKFGKLSLRCRECRIVAHVECRNRCPLPCSPVNNSERCVQGPLAEYVPASSPMIPPLLVQCASEIEMRGLHEVGLYRVSGPDRVVKELKETFLRTKTALPLARVDDVHAITGLLKDFLRNLPEPLLTFRLNRAFMQAAEIGDHDNSIAATFQTISQLPVPNRDTLAFLMLHLQRVAGSPATKMDQVNLARVFGPTIVGHAVLEPDHMTLLQDMQRQPRVVERLLGLPAEYWRRFVVNLEETRSGRGEGSRHGGAPAQEVSILGPVTTPEWQMSKTPSSSSLTQRMKSTLTTPIFKNKNKSSTGYFSTPLLK
ncbi:rac GTPase-activating protein 1-like [Denticeps clupeoides]|uniref:rac GTPase-activating protein 1-like n=1 Tax=Denticeps clupeoides TaxID=299321 RepID=UPI0010A2C9ED|nr:rac GTPase-activating protein 1-like [Denticeps clupeoides]